MENNSNTFIPYNQQSYTGYSTSYNAITINNPYIDLEGESLSTMVLWQNINSENLNASQNVASKTITIPNNTNGSNPDSSMTYYTFSQIFSISTLQLALETFFNITPSTPTPPSTQQYVYNPSNYSLS